MLDERTFDTGAVEINIAQGLAAGPPLVLVHGLPGRWQEFEALIPALVPEWQVYALDYRGQGKSGRTPGEYTARFYVDDLVAFLRSLPEQAVVFGMSAGGLGALSAAAEVPDRVRALIVGDSPMDLEALVSWMSSEGFQGYFSGLMEIAGIEGPISDVREALAVMPGVDPDSLDDLALTLHPMDPGVLEYHAGGRPQEFLDGFSMETILRSIRCPVLLLQANPTLGGMLTDRAIEQAKSLLPTWGHVFLKDVGHDLGLAQGNTRPLLETVKPFLEIV